MNERQPLTRSDVLLAALALVDARGAAALTMRNLGQHLGVEAMSLYHHVRNREDLLDGMTDLLVGELPEAADDRSWEEALREFAMAVRRIALQHPAAFALVGLRPVRGPAGIAKVGALLRHLHSAGLHPDAAVVAYRLAAAYARGFSLAEIAGLTLGSDGRGQVPATPGLAPFGAALLRDPADTFRDGLEVLIAGVGTQLPAAPKRRRGRPGGHTPQLDPGTEA